MKRFSLLLVCLLGLGLSMVWAQANKNKVQRNRVAIQQPKPKYKFKAAPVYLGNSTLRGGLIAKKTFDSLVQEGLTAIDSAGIAAKVIQFRVYYKERNLYEDSLGNYYVDTEMLTDFSRGNKLNSYMGGSLVDRTKKGDTAIFDDIVVMLPDSLTVQGCPMTFVIGK